MGKLSSQPSIKKIINKFSDKFKITKESKNKFHFDGTYYGPDLVFYDKKSDKIKAILEVEQGTRKHVVGGIITADYCMGKMKERPIMLILALTKQDLKDYAKRQKMIKHYIKNLKKVIIGDLKGIISEIIKI